MLIYTLNYLSGILLNKSLHVVVMEAQFYFDWSSRTIYQVCVVGS